LAFGRRGKKLYGNRTDSKGGEGNEHKQLAIIVKMLVAEAKKNFKGGFFRGRRREGRTGGGTRRGAKRYYWGGEDGEEEEGEQERKGSW